VVLKMEAVLLLMMMMMRAVVPDLAAGHACEAPPWCR